MACDEHFFKPDFAPDKADFVFVQIFERLNYKPFRNQSLNAVYAVVVCLDNVRVFRAARFDNIRLERTLTEQPFFRVEVLLFNNFVSDSDECLANSLALFLRVCLFFDGGKERL